MTRRWTLISIVLIGFVILAVGVLMAAEKAAKLPTEPPDVVIIDDEGFKKKTKGPVTFHHKKHEEEYENAQGKKIPCTECHHHYAEDGKTNLWKEGDPVKNCASEGCHDPNKTVDHRLKLQLAYHKNCKDCHKAVVKAGLKTDKEAPYKKCLSCMGKK